MFRIRRVPDQTLPRDRDAIDKVCEIIRQQFPKIADAEIVKLPKFLSDPVKHGFRTQLYVAEDPPRCIRGFAILLHFPDLRFSYLDFLSAAPKVMGRGIGGALYERVREDALILGARGLYYECLPDDPALCPGAALLAENAARLKFYEAYGARPIIGTAYETPLKPDAVCPPYLVWDPLGRRTPLRRAEARPVVRAILERKYRGYCPPEYVEKVVASFRDDPVRVRPPKYARKEQVPSVILRRPRYIDQRIAVVVNDRHEIHHVRERGYIESPVRVGRILREIRRLDVFERAKARRFPEAPIRAVHDGAFVDYLKKACSGLEPGWSIYPYVFPVRNAARPPRDLAMRAGYYCLDTFTPLNRNAFLAAKGSVDCALTAARLIREGYRIAYALVRPPGHHAEKRAFGGFCYFNSAAIAANDLSAEGKVAILDLDYHHGNGTQEIFYERSDVLTISIHGHPRFAYPYFNGFPEERGLGE
ncbi:MAG: acetylpolyamine amidohydrolase, partial [Planctomycetes bacterium]|nr:acetylpolyamine amidohydrolase [Planctomycetota bacterium]